MDSLLNKKTSKPVTGRKRWLYHLPPTAVPVTKRDFLGAVRAVIEPRLSYDEFILNIAKLSGTSNCFLTGSGRLALLIILLAIKKKSTRRKVILPAYTCPTVAQAIIEAGLEPFFCDVCLETLDMKREALKDILSDEILAIIPTHLYGLVADTSDLHNVCHDLGIIVIEDAAQAFGATQKGAMVGTQGDAGFFSLGRGKCLPTGHGGIILSKDGFAAGIAETMREMSLRKKRRELLSIAHLLMYSLATNPRGWWLVLHSPMNPARIETRQAKLPKIRREPFSPTQAGIGSSMLARIEIMNWIRRKNAETLRNICSGYDFIALPKIPKDSSPVYLRFPVILNSQANADRLFQHLSKYGIGVSRSYTCTLPDIYLPHESIGVQSFPGAGHLARCLLTLPTHSYMDSESFERIHLVLETLER